MAMKFVSENIEVPVDMDMGTVSVNLYSEFDLPDDDMQPNFLVSSLVLNEDQAVELATMLLSGATKLRAERLAGLGL